MKRDRERLWYIAEKVGRNESAVRELAEQLLDNELNVDDQVQRLERKNEFDHAGDVAYKILAQWSISTAKEATRKNLHQALTKHFPEVAKKLEPFFLQRNGKNTSKLTNQLNDSLEKAHLLVLRQRLEFDQSNCSCLFGKSVSYF